MLPKQKGVSPSCSTQSGASSIATWCTGRPSISHPCNARVLTTYRVHSCLQKYSRTKRTQLTLDETVSLHICIPCQKQELQRYYSNDHIVVANSEGVLAPYCFLALLRPRVDRACVTDCPQCAWALWQLQGLHAAFISAQLAHACCAA